MGEGAVEIGYNGGPRTSTAEAEPNETDPVQADNLTTRVIFRAAAGDYDGDGKADLAVFRPAGALWIIRQTTAGPQATLSNSQTCR